MGRCPCLQSPSLRCTPEFSPTCGRTRQQAGLLRKQACSRVREEGALEVRFCRDRCDRFRQLLFVLLLLLVHSATAHACLVPCLYSALRVKHSLIFVFVERAPPMQACGSRAAWDSYLRALRMVPGPLTLTCMAQTWERHAKAALLGGARYGAGCPQAIVGDVAQCVERSGRGLKACLRQYECASMASKRLL